HPDSPKGHALDHFAFSCDNLDATLDRLRKDGVKIVEEPQMRLNGAMKSAFIQAPDNVLVELAEGRAQRGSLEQGLTASVDAKSKQHAARRAAPTTVTRTDVQPSARNPRAR